jgi:aarF domain-containing kinase
MWPTQIRVFVVVAKYCATAVWEDERQAVFDGMRGSGLLSPGRLVEYFSAWWCVMRSSYPFYLTLAVSRRYERLYCGFVVFEWYLDIQAQTRKFTAWFRGLRRTGLEGAYKAAAGLT